jgi:hypothetical protein
VFSRSRQGSIDVRYNAPTSVHQLITFVAICGTYFNIYWPQTSYTKNSDRYASTITLLCWSLSSRRSVFTARYELICNYLLREFRSLSRPCHGSALVPRLLPRRPGFDSRSVVGSVAIERVCFPVLPVFLLSVSCDYSSYQKDKRPQSLRTCSQ